MSHNRRETQCTPSNGGEIPTITAKQRTKLLCPVVVQQDHRRRATVVSRVRLLQLCHAFYRIGVVPDVFDVDNPRQRVLLNTTGSIYPHHNFIASLHSLPPELSPLNDDNSKHGLSWFPPFSLLPHPTGSRGASVALSEKSRRNLRSTSLPCGFHPPVSQLNDAVRDIRCWESEQIRSLEWAIEGLVRLDHLHDSFVDLLKLTQSHNTLRSCGTAWTDRLLDGFLRLADAHGTFRSAVIELRQHQSATQAAIRGRDEARFSSCLRSQRQAEKQLARLAWAVHKIKPASSLPSEEGSVAQLAGIMSEVTMVMATASALVFSCVAAESSSTSMTASRWSRYWRKDGDKNLRSSSFDKLETLEESMRALEAKSEWAFHSLVNTRVSLLNILTPNM